MELSIDADWKGFLEPLFLEESFKKTASNIESYRANGQIIYPKDQDVFNAFNLCSLQDIKVVILGQDPYHGVNQANGLCFSLNREEPLPPSLNNIYKELCNDLNLTFPGHGNLTSWAKQGVLLINSVLTVVHGQAGSHQHLGWQSFTNGVIKLLSERMDNLVFILWGSYAQKKQDLIDIAKHCILCSVHPSPLSAHRGFFGNGHFSKTNAYLVEHGKQPVDWEIK